MFSAGEFYNPKVKTSEGLEFEFFEPKLKKKTVCPAHQRGQIPLLFYKVRVPPERSREVLSYVTFTLWQPVGSQGVGNSPLTTQGKVDVSTHSDAPGTWVPLTPQNRGFTPSPPANSGSILSITCSGITQRSRSTGRSRSFSTNFSPASIVSPPNAPSLLLDTRTSGKSFNSFSSLRFRYGSHDAPF